MSALVVVETYFGNTRHIADVVANHLRSDGIDAEVVDVVDTRTELEDGIELLVIGAPTTTQAFHGGDSAGCFARSGQVEPGIGVRQAGASDETERPSLVAVLDTRTGYRG